MLKFEWLCSQYLELNPTCPQEHIRLLAAQFLQIQYIQPIHFTSEDTPPPSREILALMPVFLQDRKLKFCSHWALSDGDAKTGDTFL